MTHSDAPTVCMRSSVTPSGGFGEDGAGFAKEPFRLKYFFTALLVPCNGPSRGITSYF